MKVFSDADLGGHDGGVPVRCERLHHEYLTGAGEVVQAIDALDLSVASGERVCVVGPSGSGKSSLLQVLAAIQRPTGGRAVVGDVDLGTVRGRALTRLRSEMLGVALQGAGRNVLPYGTVRQNVFSSAYYGRRRTRSTAVLDQVVGVLGIDGLLDRTCSVLSGGQRQRVALACALARRPRLLLADEPTSQLSHRDREAVVDLLHEVSTRSATTLVVVTHDPDVAASFPRRIAMRDGLVVEDITQ